MLSLLHSPQLAAPPARRHADVVGDGVETWLQNEGQPCHQACQMLPPGAVAGHPRWPGDEEVAHPKGFCKTSFCGVGLVACCKVGLADAPCDGIVGCAGAKCCTYTHKPPAPPAPPSPRPPSPPGVATECLGSQVVWPHATHRSKPRTPASPKASSIDQPTARARPELPPHR